MRRSQPDLTLLAGDSTFNASLLFILICSMVAVGSCGGGSAPQTANVISLTISPQFVFLTVANTQQLSASEMHSNGSHGDGQ
jgi:hypothetical protein